MGFRVWMMAWTETVAAFMLFVMKRTSWCILQTTGADPQLDHSSIRHKGPPITSVNTLLAGHHVRERQQSLSALSSPSFRSPTASSSLRRPSKTVQSTSTNTPASPTLLNTGPASIVPAV